ncbi:MAG TPA: ABC transporter permease subunit [Ardenticatenaceae bacterium]
MRSQMRGFRAFAGMTLFLVALAATSLLVYQLLALDSGGGGSSFEAGRIIFSFISGMEMLLLAALAPTLTSGAIASERQAQTFDMLMATPLTSGQVLGGKLMASMNYVFLLLVAGLPVNSLAFLFGGVEPVMLLWWLVLVVVVMLMLGTIGLLMSTLVRSSGAATALTYIFCTILFVAVPILAVTVLPLFGTGGRAVEYIMVSLVLLHPLASLAAILVNIEEFNAGMLLPATIPLYGAVAGLFFLAAEARLAHLTAQRWRRLLLTIGLLVIAVGAVAYIVMKPAQSVYNGF